MAPAAGSGAGYSGTPLPRKLGLQPHTQVLLADAPAGYRSLLEPLPEGLVWASRAAPEVALVRAFFTSRRALAAALADYRQRLAPDAVLWVSWPKKASRVETDISEDVIRALALPMGWVDVKVCAVDAVWSGLKLVLRKELR